MSKLDSCIFVTRETRNKLKNVATKAQTYDQILQELILLKKSGVGSHAVKAKPTANG